MAFYVYVLASGRNGTLYVGQTENLVVRMQQHREKAFKGFTAKYGVDRLVWFEVHEERDIALTRERQIKKWYRAWKLRTIEQSNPDWRDLYDDLLDPGHALHPDLQLAPPPPRMRGPRPVSASLDVAEVANLDPRMRGEDGRR